MSVHEFIQQVKQSPFYYIKWLFILYLSISFVRIDLAKERAGNQSATATLSKDTLVYNDPDDFSVVQVKEYIQAQLKYPESYHPVHWEKVTKVGPPYAYTVVHEYEAKNAFGIPMLYLQQFTLDTLGVVIATEIKEQRETEQKTIHHQKSVDSRVAEETVPSSSSWNRVSEREHERNVRLYGRREAEDIRRHRREAPED